MCTLYLFMFLLKKHGFSQSIVLSCTSDSFHEFCCDFKAQKYCNRLLFWRAGSAFVRKWSSKKTRRKTAFAALGSYIRNNQSLVWNISSRGGKIQFRQMTMLKLILWNCSERCQLVPRRRQIFCRKTVKHFHFVSRSLALISNLKQCKNELLPSNTNKGTASQSIKQSISKFKRPTETTQYAGLTNDVVARFSNPNDDQTHTHAKEVYYWMIRSVSWNSWQST